MEDKPDFKNHRDGTTPQELHERLNRNKPQVPTINYGHVYLYGKWRLLIMTSMGKRVVSVAYCNDGGDFEPAEMGALLYQTITTLSEAEFLAEYLKLNP